ncbi:MAG: hypothetical protein ACOX6N_01710 [Patescibacteria group bacterium]|jgi:hypothetical protein
MAVVELAGRPVIPVEQIRERALLCPVIITRNNQLPFVMQESEQVANGAFSRCFKHQDGWAIKIHEYAENGISEIERVKEILGIDKQEYEQLRKGRLGEYATETSFIIGRGPGGNVAEIQVQPWVEGRVLGEMDVSEIWSNRAILTEIREFGVSLILDGTRTGRFTDYMGFNVRKDCGFTTKIRARSLLASRNLIWDGTRLHLIDVTNHTWQKSKRLSQIKHNLAIIFCVTKDLIRINRRLKQMA